MRPYDGHFEESPPPTAEQIALAAIFRVVLHSLPTCTRYSPKEYDRLIERLVHEKVRALWAIGALPAKSGKGWVRGLRVRYMDTQISVSGNDTVGPAKPSHYRPEHSHINGYSTWNV